MRKQQFDSRVTIYFTSKDIKALDVLAMDENLTRSDLIRRAVKQYIKQSEIQELTKEMNKNFKREVTNHG